MVILYSFIFKYFYILLFFHILIFQFHILTLKGLGFLEVKQVHWTPHPSRFIYFLFNRNQIVHNDTSDCSASNDDSFGQIS